MASQAHAPRAAGSYHSGELSPLAAVYRGG